MHTAHSRNYLRFDGTDDYVEVPDSEDFSVDTTGELTVATWMRPDTLDFPAVEGTGYVHWLGKGEHGQQEWVFRMYSQGNSEGRGNRISFYLFNPEGKLGIGSYFQDDLVAGEWVHVAGVADGTSTHIYRDGVLRDTDDYADHGIVPQHGAAPLRLGTRNFASFFLGRISELRVWSRALADSEIADLHRSNIVPPDGLVAEYLMQESTGSIAHDSIDGHDGTLFGATWSKHH